MAGRIPQEFITQLLEEADIIDILSQKIALKKAGREYKACCPFHNEKTPSFTVSPDKQVYHCFGCGASGSTIQFLMNYDNLSFVEAVEELAHYYHKDVPYESSGQGRQKKSYSSHQKKQGLAELLQQCTLHYQQNLKKSQKAKDYLKNRSLSQQIIQQFQLGYSQNQWNQLEKSFPGKQQQLIETGMLIQSDKGKTYDRFRDRIMFPIINKRGQTIAFGGRTLEKEAKPKYLNSPETPLFDKSRELYGLYQAIQHKRNPDYLIIVEGYMDVIALAQNNIPYGIASLGTATSAWQIKDALRNCQQLIFCYDGDSAGQKAAWRAAETSLTLMKENLDIRFITLPEAHDPDTFIQQQGQQAFIDLINHAQPLDEFILHYLKINNDLSTLNGKTRFTDQIKDCIENTPEGTWKQLFIDKINKTTGIQLQTTNPIKSTRHFSKKYHVEMTPVRKLIAYVLKDPHKAWKLAEKKNIFTLEHKGMKMLSQICALIIQKDLHHQASLMSVFINEPYFQELNHLANWQPAQLEDSDAEFHDIMNNFHNEYLNFRKKQLLDKLAFDTLTTDEAEELRQLQHQQNRT